MRKTITAIVTSALLALSLTQVATGAAQATSFDAVQNGTGNWYRLVTSALSLDDATAAAENSVLGGAAGHLVTIDSGNENTFVAGVADGNNVWLGAGRYSSGTGFEYRWSVGPDADLAFTGCKDYFATCSTLNSLFTAWDRDNSQPDGDLYNEDSVAMDASGKWFDTISWNDDQAIVGYVIEYEVSEMTENPDPGSGGGGTDPGATPSTFIVGNIVVGDIVAADISEWPAGANVTYQWLLDGEDIVGATGSKYTIVAEDVDRELSLRVTGTVDGAEANSVSEATAVGRGTIDPAPAPTIGGTAKVGKTLTAVTGTWMAGVELSYQWFAGDDEIDGAIDPTLKLEGSYVNTFVSVQVTATLDGYEDSYETSDGVEVLPGTLTKTAVPTIGGVLKTGQKLTATEHTWDSGVTFKYVWSANGKTITGATAKTYTLTSAEFGKTITVKITGSLQGYTSVSKTSVATAKIAAGVMTAPTPLIVGGTKGAKFVTVNPGVWPTGAKLTYQWLLDGKAIKGSKSAKLTLNAKMKKHKISVAVTGTATGFASLTKTSVALKITW